MISCEEYYIRLQNCDIESGRTDEQRNACREKVTQLFTAGVLQAHKLGDPYSNTSQRKVQQMEPKRSSVGPFFGGFRVFWN